MVFESTDAEVFESSLETCWSKHNVCSFIKCATGSRCLPKYINEMYCTVVCNRMKHIAILHSAMLLSFQEEETLVGVDSIFNLTQV